ncbi:hypothetical protein EYC84_010847 [Monilinia fructicola]|uniref:Uncharacterized protein n=1 Tax=Monilinia fructicola TaxID=38448 RepID=A0A5M9JCZ3_MONFR|nr:hypothetical protein EYC84_010847 [Monilinia fructicola]
MDIVSKAIRQRLPIIHKPERHAVIPMHTNSALFGLSLTFPSSISRWFGRSFSGSLCWCFCGGFYGYP